MPNKWLVSLELLLLATVFSLPAGANAAEHKQAGVHGDAWSFGQSGERNAPLWKNGVDANGIADHATHGVKRNRHKEDAADTSGGINSALNEAEKKRVKGAVGMSMGHQSSAWKVTPDQKGDHPDETMYRDRRHIVRAYAGVKAGDDLNISVGPELILKDDRHGNETAQEDQPNSELGVGMRFKYDF